jgi:hypothetical protein
MIDVLPADNYLVRTLASGTRSALRLEPNVLPAKMPTGTASPALAVAVTCGGELRVIALYGAHRAGDDLNGDEVKMLRQAQSHLQRVKDLLTQSKGNIPPERIDQELVDEPVTSLNLASGATFRLPSSRVLLPWPTEISNLPRCVGASTNWSSRPVPFSRRLVSGTAGAAQHVRR